MSTTEQGSTAATTGSAASAGTVVELDADGFAERIPNHPFAIIDFWAPWCGPCRAFAPVFTAAAKKHEDILFAKVNTEDEQGLAGHFNIRSIPTLMIFRDNVIIFSQPGALSAGALDSLIEQARKLDMDQVRCELETQQAQQQDDSPSPGA